jgi:hypothetical protein
MENIPEAVSFLPKELLEQVEIALGKLPQEEIPTFHYFTDGMYCRIVLMCQNLAFVGRVHTKSHFFIVAKGAIRVTTDNGVEDIYAPSVLVSSAGTKRAGIVLSDCVCITVHRTNATTVEEAEADITETSPHSKYGVGNTLLKELENKE